MSPEGIGVLLGLAFVVPSIWFARRQGIEQWLWTIMLAALPVFYMAFGLLALDPRAIGLELLYGLPYMGLGIFLWRGDFPFAQGLLGAAWMSHGLYDYAHDLFFVNPGVFTWYPAFCALIDIAVGCYLAVGAVQAPWRRISD